MRTQTIRRAFVPMTVSRRSKLALLLAGITVLLLAVLSMVVLIAYLYVSGSRPVQLTPISMGNQHIQGYLYPGEDTGGKWVVFVHGNRQAGQDHELYHRMLNSLTKDVNILAIDLLGFGRSAVESWGPEQATFDRSADVLAAVDFLHQTYGVEDENIILMGHSLGASQIIKAAEGRHFRQIIAIGPGDYNYFVADTHALQVYADRLFRSTGIPIELNALRSQLNEFLPQNLYDPCPTTPVILVGGQYEHEDGLLTNLPDVPESCLATFQIITIPLADHMYGTEGIYLPEGLQFLHPIIQPIHAKLTLALFIAQLNSLLAGE